MSFIIQNNRQIHKDHPFVDAENGFFFDAFLIFLSGINGHLVPTLRLGKGRRKLGG